jgi:hypothetical protein
MMRKLLLLLLLAAVAGGAAYWFLLRPQNAARPNIAFAPTDPVTGTDPDNPTRELFVDFAELERGVPLRREDRAKLTPQNLKALSQEEVDQIYGRLTAGPIPDGYWRGDLFFRRGEGGEQTRLGEILGGLVGKVADEKIAKAQVIGRLLWKGKMFFRGERVLRNTIQDYKALGILIDNPEAALKATIPATGWRSWIGSSDDVYLFFPAKLYCGQSLLDGRRESIIIDYAFTEEIEGYQDLPDSLAGRRGLRIRDEIRMVRPGFYLGRAYVDRVFLLNFTLYDEAAAKAGLQDFLNGKDIEEDCWTGEQGLTAAK